MNRTPAQWSAVSPHAVVSGSAAQTENILKMALADIAELSAELEAMRKVAGIRLVKAIESRPFTAS
jgi:hypothetical protein